ncbi:MAG: hypothetical protein JOY62_01130 [Acidobacteriaceae bacterium]|nr:hypothetical protein [Acidobacteriaceae bacterium]MBV9778548.1 hypothetical protein [Acidobacteriaceae bacterium]
MSKRLHYFNHQFLVEQDFLDEQKYHILMRRVHNRELHSWGVVSGLHVNNTNREITVEKGFALDREGRELELLEPVTREIRTAERHPQIHVVLAYEEKFETTGDQFEDRGSAGMGVQGYNRVVESTQVKFVHSPEEVGTGVLLAICHMDAEGNITRVDHSARQSAGALIAPNSVHTKHLADGSVTEPKLGRELWEKLKPETFSLPDGSVTLEKLSTDLRAVIGTRGWVRLPFRPERLKPRTVRWPQAGEGDFSLDVEFAHCDGRGARGTMAIPVPAGATRIHEFRIAGSTRREVHVELLRTGWNPQERKGESTQLFREELRNSVFDQKFPARRELDEFHALTVSIHATGESEIWLVAARFE